MNDAKAKVALVVEDEVLVRIMTADILAARGWSVEEAGSGAEALSMLAANAAVSLLVVDISMPSGMDGLELARTASSNYPNLSILIVSGQAEPAATELPARTRFLPKPFSAQGFGWALDEVMRFA